MAFIVHSLADDLFCVAVQHIMSLLEHDSIHIALAAIEVLHTLSSRRIAALDSKTHYPNLRHRIMYICSFVKDILHLCNVSDAGRTVSTMIDLVTSTNTTECVEIADFLKEGKTVADIIKDISVKYPSVRKSTLQKLALSVRLFQSQPVDYPLHVMMILRAHQISLRLPVAWNSNTLVVVTDHLVNIVNTPRFGVEITIRALEALQEFVRQPKVRSFLYDARAFSFDGVFAKLLESCVTDIHTALQSSQESVAVASTSGTCEGQQGGLDTGATQLKALEERRIIARLVALLPVLSNLFRRPHDEISVDELSSSGRRVTDALMLETMQTAGIVRKLVDLLAMEVPLPPQVLTAVHDSLVPIIDVSIYALSSGMRNDAGAVEVFKTVHGHLETFLKDGASTAVFVSECGVVLPCSGSAGPKHHVSRAQHEQYLLGLCQLQSFLGFLLTLRPLRSSFPVSNEVFSACLEKVWKISMQDPITSSSVKLFAEQAVVLSRVVQNRPRSLASLFNLGVTNAFVQRLSKVSHIHDPSPCISLH